MEKHTIQPTYYVPRFDRTFKNLRMIKYFIDIQNCFVIQNKIQKWWKSLAHFLNFLGLFLKSKSKSYDFESSSNLNRREW